MQMRAKQHAGFERAAGLPSEMPVTLQELAANPEFIVHPQKKNVMQSAASRFEVVANSAVLVEVKAHGSGQCQLPVAIGSVHGAGLSSVRPRACGTTTLPLETTKKRSSPGITTLSRVVPSSVRCRTAAPSVR